MGLKDIFTTKKPEELEDYAEDVSIAEISGTSYTANGTRDAGLALGSYAALSPKLQATYMKLIRYIQQDERKQNERKNEIRRKISGLESGMRTLESKISSEKEKLTHEENKIEKLNDEIVDIIENPQKITGDTFVKASFWIGLVIIVFLTIYLFVFYTSAAYSAFFKNFTADDTAVVKSIFDAQAISNALYDGFTELIFIIAIPAVFLGLGFLMYKFSEGKGVGKYFKITGLVATTFIFDFIIAYEIVEKIYNIKKEGSFETMPDMTIAMSVQQINFWLIIFAGFVVYIIWGFVFSFVMQEYEKMDKVRYAIKSKEKKLSEYKIECKEIKQKKENLETQKESYQSEINELKIQLEKYVLYFNDVREGINNYFSGWVSYMKSARMSQSDISQCTGIKDKFLDDLQNSEFIKSN
jgi:peptidoglycan hydrolase CwlO-like protein